MTFNFLSRKAWILLMIYLSLWGFVDFLLTKQIFIKSTGLLDVINSEKNVLNVINNHYFWATWLGVVIRVFLEISFVSTIIFWACKVLKYSITYRKCLTVTVFAHCVFLLQFVFEFIFFKSDTSYLQTHAIENFSLFSISHYLKNFKIRYPWELDYLFQTINLFEIIYWLLLGLFLSIALSKTFKTGFKLIALSYIPILFIWLLSISFLLIMFSK